MKTCTKHQHSSDETARKCYAKAMQKSVDKRFGKYWVPEMIRYKLVKYSPPLEVNLSGIKVFYFFRGEQK